MGTFDALFKYIIDETLKSFEGMDGRAWEYAQLQPWPGSEGGNILRGGGNTVLEMGGSLRHGAHYLCATTDENADVADRVMLYGPDLSELRGEAPYGRISIVKLCGDGMDDRQIFNAMLDLDVSKHRVDPDGFAVGYQEAARYETVKVDADALRKGLSLANIGACYIERYKMDKRVLAVTEIFVTEPAYDFAAAEERGRRVQKAMVTMRAHSMMPRIVRQQLQDQE